MVKFTVPFRYCGLVVVAVLLSGCMTPENIEVTKTYPDRVTSGEIFTIEVTVKNTADRERNLRSINVAHSFLDGFFVNEPNRRQPKNMKRLGSIFLS